MRLRRLRLLPKSHGPASQAAAGWADDRAVCSHACATMDHRTCVTRSRHPQRWGVSTERVIEKAVKDGVLHVHALVGDRRITLTPLANGAAWHGIPPEGEEWLAGEAD